MNFKFKNLFVLLFAVAIVFTSCKKDKNDPAPSIDSKKLIGYWEFDNTVGKHVYQFDADNKAFKHTEAFGQKGKYEESKEELKWAIDGKMLKVTSTDGKSTYLALDINKLDDKVLEIGAESIKQTFTKIEKPTFYVKDEGRIN